MAEILFSNVNLPRHTFLHSGIEELASYARKMGYDGLEYMIVRSKSLRELKQGKNGSEHVLGLHEGFPFSTQLDPSPFKSAVKDFTYSLRMPPARLGPFLPSVRHMQAIHQLRGGLSAVVYPDRLGKVQQDKRRKAALEDVTFQPCGEVEDIWKVKTTDDYLRHAQSRGFAFCFDTFHARRQSRISQRHPIPWTEWMPRVTEEGLLQRIHFSGYRGDFDDISPGIVMRTNAEMDALIFEETLTGELKEILLVAAKDGNLVKAVTVEMPHGGVVAALQRRKLRTTPKNVRLVHRTAATALRSIFNPGVN